jgi:hypothetical protein
MAKKKTKKAKSKISKTILDLHRYFQKKGEEGIKDLKKYLKLLELGGIGEIGEMGELGEIGEMAGCGTQRTTKKIGGEDITFLPLQMKPIPRIEIFLIPQMFNVGKAGAKKKTFKAKPIQFLTDFDKRIWASVVDKSGKIWTIPQETFRIILKGR